MRCFQCRGTFRAPAAPKGQGASDKADPARRGAGVASPADKVEVDELEEVPDAEDSETAPASDEPEELEVVEPARKRKKKRQGVPRDGDYGRVSFGLGFFCYSLMAAMAGFLPLLLSIIGAIGGFSRYIVPVTILAIILVDWVASGLGLTGAILCLRAPRASGARDLAVVSLALNACAMLVGLMQSVLTCISVLVRISAFGTIPAFLLTFAGWWVFMLFLKKLCTDMARPDLAEEADNLIQLAMSILFLTPILLGATPLVCCGPLLWHYAIFSIVGGYVCGPIALYRFFCRQFNLIATTQHLIEARY